MPANGKEKEGTNVLVKKVRMGFAWWDRPGWGGTRSSQEIKQG